MLASVRPIVGVLLAHVNPQSYLRRERFVTRGAFEWFESRMRSHVLRQLQQSGEPIRAMYLVANVLSVGRVVVHQAHVSLQDMFLCKRLSALFTAERALSCMLSQMNFKLTSRLEPLLAIRALKAICVNISMR